MPFPQPAAEGNSIRLSGGTWKVQRASEVKGNGEEIASAGFQTDGWIPATVPGTVLSSYKNIGALPDPNYSANQLNVSESFFNSNFWYRNEFTVPEGFIKDQVFLNFDGINWKAHVYLNGRKAGDIEARVHPRQTGCDGADCSRKECSFGRDREEQPRGLSRKRTSRALASNGGITGADNPTFHATIGWDWIPTVHGRNIGIWNDVKLVSTGNANRQ